MSNLSKQALKVENSVSFPNNNTGYITPAALRDFNVNMIDSVVVNSGTASFASTGSNSFNGDQTISGDLQMNNTGVIGTNYIETAGSQTLQLNADNVSVLGTLDVDSAITASIVSASIAGIGNVTAYSASVDNRLNNLTGSQGATGAQGASGTNGTNGAQGANGSTGAQGSTGTQGPGAAQGQIGIQGVQGYIGSQGTQGATGAGTQGATGSTGGQGAQGVRGEQGEQGIQGAQGTQGTIGEKGDQGIQGRTGTQGAVGAQGSTGTGTQGAVGAQGSTGTGTQGAQGTAGTTPSTASFAVLSGGNSFNGDQQLNGGFNMTGSLDVNGVNIINTINGLSSLTSSYATLGGNQVFTGNNTITGNTVVSQSATFGTASFYGPVQIAKGIVGDVDVTGSLVASKIGAYDFDVLYYGSQLGGTTTNGTFFGYGSNSYEFVVGAYSGPNDNELKITTNNSGIQFGDFNGSSYPTFLKLNPNSGTNPAPELVRGVNVTGSLGLSGSFRQTGQTYISGNVQVSGSITLATDGANGHAFSAKALFLTNSVQTGITVESPIHFYQVGKGDMYIQNNVAGVGSGSINITAANGANLNISSSNLISNGTSTIVNVGDLIVGKDPTADIYNGFKVDRTGNNYAVYNLATASAVFDIGAVDGVNFSYSTELLVTATPSQVTLQDFSIGDYSYKTWLAIPQNTGNNPAPQFKRGLASTGSITIQSGSGDLYVHGNKQFNYGAFQTNISHSGSSAVSQSVPFEITDSASGFVCDALSNYKEVRAQQSGTYLINFSAQVEANAGGDTIYIWLKKNGTNIAESASKVILPNNTAQLMTVNFILPMTTNDYFEVVWQNVNGYGVLLAENASGNIPAIPAVILTVSQIR